MKSKFIKYYMDVAIRTAELSYCNRLKVGAIIVKDDRIVSIGYNGSPAGWNNCCEKDTFAQNTDAAMWMDVEDYERLFPLVNEDGLRYKSETLPEVLHAEMNCLSKLAKGHESGDGATMFLTHAPCIHCAKMIYQSGIMEVYYKDTYRSTDGLKFLTTCKVKHTKIK